MTSTGSDSPVTSEASTALVPSTTRPSVATFSPGRTTNRSPTASSSTGMRTSVVARVVGSTRSTATSLAPRVISPRRASRVRSVARASIQRPNEQEGRDDGGGLEPDVRGGDVSGIHARHAGGAAGEHDDGRPQVGGEHADRHQGVHRRGTVAGVQGGGAVERPARPEHDGRREHELDQRAVVEVDAGHHRQHDDRHGEHGGDQGPALEGVLGRDLVVAVPNRP